MHKCSVCADWNRSESTNSVLLTWCEKMPVLFFVGPALDPHQWHFQRDLINRIRNLCLIPEKKYYPSLRRPYDCSMEAGKKSEFVSSYFVFIGFFLYLHQIHHCFYQIWLAFRRLHVNLCFLFFRSEATSYWKPISLSFQRCLPLEARWLNQFCCEELLQETNFALACHRDMVGEFS